MGVLAANRLPLRQFAHVRICNKNHPYYSQTGTVIRTDVNGRVWVALPGGTVIRTRHLSLEVVARRMGAVIVPIHQV